MKERCYSPTHKSYGRYGNRGIGMCDEWKDDFRTFCEWAMASGYDPDAPYGRCTIERIDNSKGYSPDNCKWVTLKEQAHNRRNNRPVEAFGETHLVSEWAEIVGLNRTTLIKRLDLGWNVVDALTRPIDRRKSSILREGRA